MNIGDKVFVVRYMRWGNRDQYSAGAVEKITPSGLIDVRYGDRVTRFSKDMREYGCRVAESACIDTQMPYDERVKQVGLETRIDRAHAALNAVTKVDESKKRSRYDKKEDLVEEFERLRALMSAAQQLILAV